MPVNITRKVIDTTVKWSIDEIKYDTERAIRRLVDLGMSFSSGRFQKSFFRIAQTMLENEQSAYYRHIAQIAKRVDEDNLRVFGVNVGYNGCTLGAKIIRDNEAAFGFNIPWAITIECKCKDKVNSKNLEKLVTQGEKLGVYVYLIFISGTDVMSVRNLIKSHQDSAFCLFISEKAPQVHELDGFKSLKNIMLCYSINDIEVVEETNLLTSSFFICNGQSDKRVLSGEIVGEAVKRNSAFLFIISCDEGNSDEIYSYVQAVRDTQKHPIFICDVRQDIRLIDSIISDDECCIAFDGEGSVIGFDNLSIEDTSLSGILKITAPKDNWNS